jgi:hypothetical protein
MDEDVRETGALREGVSAIGAASNALSAHSKTHARRRGREHARHAWIVKAHKRAMRTASAPCASWC